ncbi:MAG: indolepyruvate ferredoxin oxidoreductase subunit alpha [Desulfobacterales bacterium]|jgi:indolepyruvate ferredoxin oxidoreductase, alpha subunit|nr:indolepyruvate ferredoxin oxidoreductase subunit alpha [Desulfobacteraceae bacterium]MBT7085803.1 indolepyruvate ferredoxin oxidoreductase subunit alpha [Desulfobacterales bacterium]
MHKLLVDNPGQKSLLLGNEAIARGAIEAGVAFTSTYPGTPSSEISLNFFQVSQESDLYFEYSTNEKVALEVASAAANSGVRSMCVMKHVGVNVAADALMTLAYVGVKKGLVILTADDPYMFSSQNEQDNRYYGKLSGLPILEPSSVDEAKEMIIHAFDLSEKLQEPVIFRTTTRINHSTAIVEYGALKERITKGDFTKDPFNYVTVPAVSRRLHVKLLENYKKSEELTNTSEYNFINGTGPYGIICNGVSYGYVSDAVNDLCIKDKVKVLRIGFSHPMPKSVIRDFFNGCEKILVIEEGEAYMEEAIKAIAQENKITIPIAGKTEDLLSRLYEFDPALVRESMAKYFNIPYKAIDKPDLTDIPEIPQRPPNLCAGCSHRATFYALQKASEGMETIIPNDIGCYTLGFMPPLSVGDFLICMGSSTGTAGGFAQTTDKKVISVIGDSTFFHSGIPGLINGVFNNHNFTLVILDNETTAMTGHQPNPGVDMKGLNFEGYGQISIEKVVKGLGVQHVTIIKPYKIRKSVEAIREALDFKGVSVIISKEPCTLYEKSLKKKQRKPFYVSDKCKKHKDCINDLGCPAFFIEDSNIKIDPAMCTGCAVCAQICPENAIMPVKDN